MAFTFEKLEVYQKAVTVCRRVQNELRAILAFRGSSTSPMSPFPRNRPYIPAAHAGLKASLMHARKAKAGNTDNRGGRRGSR
jgi:hypothetical protein